MFTVHSIIGSPFGRAVLATLIEKDAPYRIQALGPGAHRGPEHIARHPFGRVPAIDHDGFQLYETQAILRYIDRILTEPALTPDGAKNAARMDQVMNICDCYFFRGVGNVIAFERVVGPALMGKTPDEAAIAAAMPAGKLVFAELSKLLGEAPYFGGPKVSLADVLVAPHMDFFTGIPEWNDLTGGHENLQRWIARMNERPSMQATTWPKVSAMAA